MHLKYPLKLSDFEVQAELYWFLKNKGFDVRGEVTVKKDRKKNMRGARFDLVIFIKKIPLAIIEAKNMNRKFIYDVHPKTLHYSNISSVKQFTFYQNDNPEYLLKALQKLKIHNLNKKGSSPFMPNDIKA